MNITITLPQEFVGFEDNEKERLFGEDVDYCVNLNKSRILYQITHKATTRPIYDNDIWVSFASLLTLKDIQNLLDVVMPSKVSQKRYINRHCNSESIVRNMTALLENLYDDNKDKRAIWNCLEDAMKKRMAEYSTVMADKKRFVSPFEMRMNEFKSLTQLSEDEMNILTVLFLLQSHQLLLGEFTPKEYSEPLDIKKLADVTGLTTRKTIEYLSSNNGIRRFQVLDQDNDIDGDFMNFFTGISDMPLSERFWTHYKGEALPWDYYGQVAEHQGAIIAELIQSKPKDEGTSILLYGRPGTGKTSIATSLGKLLNKEVYFIAQNSNDNSCSSYSANFRYAALAAAQMRLSAEKCLLIVDECDNMIESHEYGHSFNPFNSRRDEADAKGQLNNVLDNNRHTIIWICNSDRNAISESSRRRFDYSIYFDDMLPEVRARIWENSLEINNCKGLLTNDFIHNLANAYVINAGSIAITVKNAAAIIKNNPEKDFSKYIMEFLQAHCELLDISRKQEEHLKPAMDYTLDGLNIHSCVSLENIIDACRNYLANNTSMHKQNRDKPRMCLLLHGVPGSGKTEFVKYLASVLRMKLNLMNAADLLDCYVGETEHKIVNAFAKAQQNKEILFFDEGDSLLFPRNEASKSWEISQVNVLLSEMEKFDGIFIISTNLIQRLDNAVLRRFTFRIHFDFLADYGKVKFFNTYFNYLELPALTEQETKELCSIPKMTPSDFRNVRQQFFYLAETDWTNAKIIAALREETQSRDSQAGYKNYGENKHAIGFDAG